MTSARLSPFRTILLAASLVALAIPAGASAATGTFTYDGCLSGNTSDGPSGSNACSMLSTAGSVGGGSGINGAKSVAMSPDGKSVYVAAPIDDAIATFSRNTSTGALTFQSCITGQSSAPASTNCGHTTVTTADGTSSGLGDPVSLAVSPDGLSVYVAAASDASIARFNRNTTTGALTYQDCITGSTQVGPMPTGSGACSLITHGASGGLDSGLFAPSAVAVSPDNADVYLTAATDDSIATFSRNTGNGVITYQSCITGQSAVVTAGSCASNGTAQTSGQNSGLDNPDSIGVASGGASVYVTSMDDDAVATFSRNTGNGVLGYLGCVSGETQSAASCPAQLPHASSGGADSGLDQPTSLALSPNGDSLYVSAQLDDAVVRFDRNTGNGALTYQGCLGSETQSGPGIGNSGACTMTPHASSNAVSAEIRGPLGVAVSPDGQQVYASTFFSTEVELDRASGGALSFNSCITGNSAGGPSGTGACAAVPSAVGGGLNSGILQLESVAVGPDSTSLYAVSSADDSVATFSLVPPSSGAPPAANPPPPAPSPTPVAVTPTKKCKKAKKGAAAAKCKKKRKK